MTDSTGTETPKTPAQAQPEPVVAAAALPAAVTMDAPANPAQNTDIPAPTDSPAQAEQSEATSLALSNLEQQLGQLNAYILAMQQQLSDAASEPNAETEEARGTLALLRAAASEVQSTIAEVKTSRRPVSAAALSQLSARIGGIITEATEESAELNSSVSESRSHSARRTASIVATNTAASRPSLASRVNAAILGRHAANTAQSGGHGDDEEDEFLAQMNPSDGRNRDGTVSGREAVGGAIGLARAAGSRRKRETAWRIVGEVSDAAARNDRRGILDGSLSAGRGVARVTGSEDVGHAVTVIVGTGITKTTTAGNLVSDGRVSDMANAALRNTDAAISYVADATGISSVTNWLGYQTLTRDQIEPFIGALMNDRQYDWERLVNARNVKQFDTDGNGRIDAGEILGVLRNNGITFDRVDADDDGRIELQELRAQLIAIARRNNARVEGRIAAPAVVNPNRGRIVALDGHGQIRIEQARTILQNEGVRIDANRDGTVTYGECLAAIAQWNNTHNANGQPLTAAPRRPAPARRQPD